LQREFCSMNHEETEMFRVPRPAGGWTDRRKFSWSWKRPSGLTRKVNYGDGGGDGLDNT